MLPEADLALYSWTSPVIYATSISKSLRAGKRIDAHLNIRLLGENVGRVSRARGLLAVGACVRVSMVPTYKVREPRTKEIVAREVLTELATAEDVGSDSQWQAICFSSVVLTVTLQPPQRH